MTTEERYKSEVSKGFGGVIDKFEREGVGILIDDSRMVCVGNVANGGLGRNALKIDVKIGFTKSGSHHLNLGALEVFS